MKLREKTQTTTNHIPLPQIHEWPNVEIKNAGRPARQPRAGGRAFGRAAGRAGGRAGGRKHVLGKAKNNMLRLNPQSNGGRNQIIHDQGRPEHVIGPYP